MKSDGTKKRQRIATVVGFKNTSEFLNMNERNELNKS